MQKIYINIKIESRIKAFTLIEMIVTISLVAILAGMAIANFARVKSERDLIDEATILVSEACNLVAAESLNINEARDLCSITAGTGSGRAGCNATAGPNGFNWDNVNNNVFNVQVAVRVTNSPSAGNVNITKISYSRGLISSVRYLNAAADTNITGSNEADISPIIITVSLRSNANCFNSIRLWPNNVIEVVEAGRCAGGRN